MIVPQLLLCSFLCRELISWFTKKTESECRALVNAKAKLIGLCPLYVNTWVPLVNCPTLSWSNLRLTSLIPILILQARIKHIDIGFTLNNQVAKGLLDHVSSSQIKDQLADVMTKNLRSNFHIISRDPRPSGSIREHSTERYSTLLSSLLLLSFKVCEAFPIQILHINYIFKKRFCILSFQVCEAFQTQILLKLVQRSKFKVLCNSTCELNLQSNYLFY